MARKKNKRNKSTLQPATTSLWYEMPTADTFGVTRFIDLASDLSRLNRKLFRQGYQYAVAGITITDDVAEAIPDPDPLNPPTYTPVPQPLDVSVSTAGNTWVTQNAWVKGKALWDQMNQHALQDNPSIQGTWSDYKVSLTENMNSGNTISARNGAAGALLGGYEWAKSTYVLPQHDVDANGEPEAAEEFTACLVGPDDLTGKVFSLTNAYEESRATVQTFNSPNVPGALPDSFYLKLTDDGSQDPELAAVIMDANDQPPYAMAAGAYPGGGAYSTSEATTRVARGVKNSFTPTMMLGGFTAECGLIRIDAVRGAADGVLTHPNCRLQIHLVPGNYRGILALPMGQ